VKERIEERVEATASARGTGRRSSGVKRKNSNISSGGDTSEKEVKKEKEREREREGVFMSGGHLYGLPPLLSPTIKAGGIPAACATVLCIAIVVIVVVAARV